MEITFLGTGCMVPTKDRNVTAQFVRFKNEGFLIDCGEGTQRQMSLAGINRNKVTKVLITHWHGDHTSGLIGLLQTVGNAVDGKKMMIFGPVGTKRHVQALLDSVVHENKLDLDIRELDPDGVEVVFKGAGYSIQAVNLEHSTPCVGYSLVEDDSWNVDSEKAKSMGLSPGPMIEELKEKGELNGVGVEEVAEKKRGKKLTFIFDTQLCQPCYDLAKDADVLVCECSYAADLEEKAIQYKHLTTKHAAVIASTANVKKLIATHFSQRYKDVSPLKEELERVFPDVVLAYDLMSYRV